MLPPLHIESVHTALRIRKLSCPPTEFGGCPEPTVGSGVVLDGTLRVWSNPDIWAELENAADVLDSATGLPKTGANLTIPGSWDLVLDMDTPVLEHLELQGRLSFDPEQDVVLNTHTMVIFGGTLAAGTATEPHPAKVCASSAALISAVYTCRHVMKRYTSRLYISAHIIFLRTSDNVGTSPLEIDVLLSN